METSVISFSVKQQFTWPTQAGMQEHLDRQCEWRRGPSLCQDLWLGKHVRKKVCSPVTTLSKAECSPQNNLQSPFKKLPQLGHCTVQCAVIILVTGCVFAHNVPLFRFLFAVCNQCMEC